MVDSDLKVGSSNAEGVYVKDTQLLQFDWSKLQSNLSYVFDSVVRTDFPLMIANLSSHQIYLYRDNQLTVVEPGKIDWYTVGYNENPVSETVITNPNDVAVRAIGFHSNKVTQVILRQLKPYIDLQKIWKKVINATYLYYVRGG